jgi:anti-sigma-K factor RskA
MSVHENMLDDVAAYALGVLPADQARTVAAHLATCEECRREYRLLRPAVNAVGISAEACVDAASALDSVAPPGPLLKKRIMQQIRPNVGEMRAVRPIVWPAYAVAAACLIVALVTGIVNISLNSELRQRQTQLAQISAHNAQTTRELAYQRTALADLVSPDSQHFAVRTGEVVRHGTRMYLAMNALPAPPKGKVYEAWTLKNGAKVMSPSVTFVPDRNGVAVVQVPVDASRIAAVALSVEPEGGSKQPTSTPTFVLKLS